jgi:hypothetical protein
VSFAAVTLCVASQRVSIVVVYFVVHSVRKLLDTPLYILYTTYNFTFEKDYRPRAVIAQPVWRWATGWTIGILRFDSRQGLGIFLFTTASRTALGPTQPPTQWLPGALSLGVKLPGREGDHSPPSSVEVK